MFYGLHDSHLQIKKTIAQQNQMEQLMREPKEGHAEVGAHIGGLCPKPLCSTALSCDAEILLKYRGNELT